MIAVRRDQGKFVTPKPRQVSTGIDGKRAQLLRQFAQQVVADRVAKYVIDHLEAVEVDAQHRKRFITGRRRIDRAGEMLDEGGAIGQVRQGIIMGQMLNEGLRLLALGNVLRKAEQVSRFAGLIRDRKILGGQDASAVVMGMNDVLVNGLQLPGGQGFPHEREQVGSGLLVGSMPGTPADQVAARDPENGFGGAVDENIAAIARVLDSNRQRHVLDDVVEKILVRPSSAAEASRASS
jgi:hypothetical protein